MQETRVQFLSKKIPWRRKWQLTPVFLPGKSHRQRSLEGYSPWGSQRVGHNLANLVTKQQQNTGAEGSMTCPKTHRIAGPCTQGPEEGVPRSQSSREENLWAVLVPCGSDPTLLPHKPFLTQNFKNNFCTKIWKWKSTQTCQLIFVAKLGHFLWTSSVCINAHNPLWSPRIQTPGQFFFSL